MGSIQDQSRRLAAMVLYASLVIVSGLVVLQWIQQRPVILSVQSDSMEPVFRKGDAIILQKTPPTLLSPGDIVSYPHPDKADVIISHRVVSADAYTGKLITKGDANVAPDQVTSTLGVLGRVGYAVPKAGFVVDWLHSWQGLAVLVYLPVAALLAQELLRLGHQYGRPTYAVAGRGPMVPLALRRAVYRR